MDLYICQTIVERTLRFRGNITKSFLIRDIVRRSIGDNRRKTFDPTLVQDFSVHPTLETCETTCIMRHHECDFQRTGFGELALDFCDDRIPFIEVFLDDWNGNDRPYRFRHTFVSTVQTVPQN